jgi:long-chain acyl-CoA synthetase
MEPNRPWVSSYPAGVAADLPADYADSLNDLLGAALVRFADRSAFECDGSAITYAELDELSQMIAYWLSGIGLEKGTRVALMMPNILHHPVCSLGIFRAGSVCVNVNPYYTSAELEHQIQDSGAEVILVLDNLVSKVLAMSCFHQLRYVITASVADFDDISDITTGSPREPGPLPPVGKPTRIPFVELLSSPLSSNLLPRVDGDDIAVLQYTGGTTGVSKGAVLLHRNIAANLAQYDTWLRGHFETHDGQQMLMLCPMPLYHISAFTLGSLFGIMQGFLTVLIPNPRNQDSIVRAFAGCPINIFPAVNTTLANLVKRSELATIDFSSLLLTISGGAAVHPTVAEDWKRVTGSTVIEGYGLSETSPIVSVNLPNSASFSGTAGFPVSSTDIQILDPEGLPLPLGEQGEIAVRGPQVMQGYWNRPDETRLAMTEDHFFKTGDIGVIDPDGALSIVDRKKDMILVSGFNVYPNEVEAAASACPGVQECVAIGVADARTSEAVKLFVVRDNVDLSAEDVITFCRHRLTGYKIPKFVEFRSELPKSTVGKILRRALR